MAQSNSSSAFPPKKRIFALAAFIAFSASLILPNLQAFAAVGLTVTPITWNIIGLDSNKPDVQGPDDFPVGIRICNPSGSGVTATNVVSTFHWDSSHPYIALRTGSLTTITTSSLSPGECVDHYYEIKLQRTTAAYSPAAGDTTGRYHISVVSDQGDNLASVQPRDLWIEHLISQNRNAVTQVQLSPSVPFTQNCDLASYSSIPAGGTMTLVKGLTYCIKMIGSTATNGYDQLESFLVLPNRVFQILSVKTLYGASSTVHVSNPNDKLYGDACLWDNDPNSPNYRSCLGVGKVGNDITVTYKVNILNVGSSNPEPLNTLLYDFSGSSFHYNSDFSTSIRYAYVFDPSSITISKQFVPDTILPGGTAKLRFTITNPTTTSISGVNFIDILPVSPGSMTTANTTTSMTGCGSSTLLAPYNGGSFVAGAGSIGFKGGTVAPNSSCVIDIQVTASVASAQTYDNTTQHLFLDGSDPGTGFDTGHGSNTAKLAVASSICIPDLTIANWVVPVSYLTPPPDKAGGAPTYGAGTAAQNGSGITWSIDASGYGGVGVWEGAKFPSTLDTTKNFSFTLNTSGYSDLKWYLSAGRSNLQSAGSYNLYYRPSGGSLTLIGGPYSFTNVDTLNPNQVNLPAGAISASTVFYVVPYGASNSGQDNKFGIDSINFTGCGTPSPAPTLTKAFSPGTIPADSLSTSTLIFTIKNQQTGNVLLSNVAFTDLLPAGLAVSSSPNWATSNVTGTCSGVSFSSSDGFTLSYVAGSMTSGAECTASVRVVATRAGLFENFSGYISSTQSGTNKNSNGFAVASLIAVSPPVIAKSFSPSPILTGNSSTLSFTITNPNQSALLTGITFTDTLPVGLSVGNSTSSTCNGVNNLLVDASARTIQLLPTGIGVTSSSLVAGGSCTFNVQVTGVNSNSYSNSVTVSSTEGGVGNTALATLVVNDPSISLNLLKQIGSGSDPDGTWSKFIAINSLPHDVYYKFTVENTGDVNLSNVSVSDLWLSGSPQGVDLSDCSWVSLPVSDPLRTCVVGPLSISSAGDHINSATAGGDYLGSPVTSLPATSRYATSGLTIVKNVVENYFSLEGDLLHFSYTVRNSGFAELLGPVTVADDKVGSIACQDVSAVGDGDIYLDPGEQVVCPASGTVAYSVQSGDVSQGYATNVATASAGGVFSNEVSKTVYKALQISGQVRNDVDHDGVLADPETGLSGVTLQLYAGSAGLPTGSVLATTTTDSSGNYAFSNLLPGSYVVVETNPAGYTSTNDKDGNSVNSFDQVAVTLVVNTNNTGNDFLDSNVANISGQVRNDVDHDGVLTDPEAGLSGVTVQLFAGSGGLPTGSILATTTTDSSGNYTFSNLLPGDYVVVETNPTGYTSTNDKDGNSVNSFDQVAFALLASTNNTGNDFLDSNVADISGQVRNDIDRDGVLADPEAGLSGVTVQLFAGSGGLPTGSILATTTTDSSGNYTFSNLLPGDYVVVETNPTGYTSTNDKDGNSVNNFDQIAVTLAPSTNSTGNDFLDSNVASISGQVRNDVNRNGVLADPETGLAGVTIQLYAGSAGLPTGSVLATTTTDSSGNYAFINLIPGDYVVVETNAAGYTSTNDKDGNSVNSFDQVAVTLAAGSSSTLNDFLDSNVANISGQVRNDVDHDGVLSDSEAGLAGVTVELYTGLDGLPSGSLLDSTTTDVSGNYIFTIRLPGDYVLVEINPAGFTSTNDKDGNSVNSFDQIAVTLAPSTNNSGNDFLDSNVSSISGQVRNDVDHDGVLADPEAGLSGVTIQLFAGLAGLPTGSVLATTTTDPSGNYAFLDLLPGDYVVVETNPSGYTSTNDQDGNSVNSFDQIAVTLAASTISNGNDFLDSNVADISGQVRNDVDHDGVLADPEAGIAGVTIQLYASSAGLPTGSVLATTTTDGSGNYIFSNLLPGDYVVVEINPSGYTSTNDKDGNSVNSFDQIAVTLLPSTNSTGNDFLDTYRALIGVAKNAVSVTEVSAGVWDVTYLIIVKNYGGMALSDIHVTDDLSATFQTGTTGTTFQVQSLSVTGGFHVSPLTGLGAFTGSGFSINLLTGVDVLPIGASETISLVVRVFPDRAGPFSNSAFGFGTPPVGSSVTDQSQDGIDPDPDRNNDPTDDNEPTLVAFVPHLFDPPIGFKTLDSSGLPVITWALVWINDSNFVAVDAVVHDPIPVGMTFVGGGASSGYPVPLSAPKFSTNLGVSCVDTSASTVTDLCYFEGPTPANPRGQIIWAGILGPDWGITDPSLALNAIHISFRASVDFGISNVQNVATIDSDLNGDGDAVDPGELIVARASASWTGTPTLLPSTGFAPGVYTEIIPQPRENAYSDLGIFWVEIPRLNLKMPIVGVPMGENGWDVTWLGSKAGWLNGTAYPTTNGNSVLTGHVYLPNGKPGPFVNLKVLSWGDQVIIHLRAEQYIFEVRGVSWVKPDNTASVLKHQDLPWVTLLTCNDYDAVNNTYRYRVAVQAVLMNVISNAPLPGAPGR